MSILDNIANELYAQRKTQKQLCDFIGIHDSAFSEWKRGKSNSYMRYLPQIAEFFGVPVDYLCRNKNAKKSVTDSRGIFERIAVEMKRQGKQQKELTDFLGLSNNAYTEWASGRSASYLRYLPQIAEFLNASLDYLGGVSIESGLSDHEKNIISAYRRFPDMQKAVDRLLKLEIEEPGSDFADIIAATQKAAAIK